MQDKQQDKWKSETNWLNLCGKVMKMSLYLRFVKEYKTLQVIYVWENFMFLVYDYVK
jgi:hypothetical protein